MTRRSRLISTALILILFATIAFCMIVSGCAAIQTTPCEDLAGVIRDAALFICTLSRPDAVTASVETKRPIVATLDMYIKLVAQAPDSEEKAALLARLQEAYQRYTDPQTGLQ